MQRKFWQTIQTMSVMYAHKFWDSFILLISCVCVWIFVISALKRSTPLYLWHQMAYFIVCKSLDQIYILHTNCFCVAICSKLYCVRFSDGNSQTLYWCAHLSKDFWSNRYFRYVLHGKCDRWAKVKQSCQRNCRFEFFLLFFVCVIHFPVYAMYCRHNKWNCDFMLWFFSVWYA